jgi:hypothetical protein
MRLYDIKSKFTTYEFACDCGCDFGQDEEHIDKNLIDKLNMMRILLGRGMVVTSGARCEEHNTAIGGVANSAHLPHHDSGQCRAVDILVRSSEDRYELLTLALKVGFNRIGIAKNFLHLDVAWDLPQQVIFDY